MSDLIVHESFNLFVGDAGPDNTKHLVIGNLKIPDMEELTQQFHAGGSVRGVEVGGLGFKELSSGFKLVGWDPQSMSQFGIGSRSKFPYTAYGNARSKATGTAVQIKCVMWARLTKIGVPELKRGDLFGCDHELKEILHYELYYNGTEKYYWDWQTALWRVDGVVQNMDEINNLAIPTS